MISRKRILGFAIGKMLRQDGWAEKYNSKNQFNVNQYDYSTCKEYVNVLKEKWQEYEDPEYELEDYVNVSNYSNYDDYAYDIDTYRTKLEWRDEWDCDCEFDVNPCDFEYEEYYIKALKKLVRKLDLDQMKEMQFNTPYECIQYCIANSTSLRKTRISSLQSMLEEISHLELDKVYEIYFYCLECLDDKKKLENALDTIQYLESTNRVGVRDYIVKGELFGKRLDDYKELDDLFELFDSIDVSDTDDYGIHDAFEAVELFQYLIDLHARFNRFKHGHIAPFLIDLIYKEIKPEDSIYNLKKQCTYDELFAITYILNQLLGALFTEQKLVLIDEFQDLSAAEIEFLNSLMPESIFNYYGDVLQCMNSKGIHTKEELNRLLPNVEQHELSVNYRNTYEITNYVNDALSFDSKMIATGVEGKVEKIIMDMNTISDKIINHIKTNDRVAFIVKDKNKVSKDILKHLNIIDIRENSDVSI